MQNITAGKIEGRSKLGGSGRLIMSLFVHQLVTDQAKLDTILNPYTMTEPGILGKDPMDQLRDS